MYGCSNQSSALRSIWRRRSLLAVSDRLWRRWCSRIVGGHRRVAWACCRRACGRGPSRRTGEGSLWGTGESLCGADAGSAALVRYRGSLKVGNDRAHCVVLVLVRWCCRRYRVWICNDLKLVRLHDPSQRVQEHACIVLCPEVDVEGV